MCMPLQQNTKVFYNKEEYDTVKCRKYTFVITCYYFTIILFSIITYFTIYCHHVILYIYCDNCDIYNISRFYCVCYVIIISLHYIIISLLL